MENQIPKIIHYIWVGSKDKPQLVKDCIESWKTFCPDYQIIEWNESNFDLNSYPILKVALDQKNYALISDVIRLAVLKEYGGIYLDTDVKLIKNLDDLLTYDGFFSYESNYWLGTAVAGAKKDLELISVILSRYRNINKIDFNTNALAVHAVSAAIRINYNIKPNGKFQVVNNIALLPQDYFFAMDYMTLKTNITNNTYGIHLYKGSWHTKGQKRGLRFAQRSRKILGKRIFAIFEKIVARSYFKKLKKEYRNLTEG